MLETLILVSLSQTLTYKLTIVQTDVLITHCCMYLLSHHFSF